MTLKFKYPGELCTILKKASNTLLLAISINNFFSLLVDKEKYHAEKLIIKLQQIIENEINSQSFRLTYNIFFIVKRNIKPSQINQLLDKVNKIILNYGVNHSIIPVQLFSSIGYTFFKKQNKETVEETINKSIVALSVSLNKKSFNICNYDNEKNSIKYSYAQMIQSSYLHDAIKNNNVQLAFQPIICSRTGKVNSYECLLRIIVNKEIISAGDFINATENFGFITMIDKFVFQMVIKELAQEQNIHLTVNVSTYSIEDVSFLQFCKQSIINSLLSKRLTIEITETGIPHNYKQIMTFINTMRDMGCKISIDDFGTGYTSIKQLSNFAVDFIKIDGSFIKDLKTNKQNQKFVEVIIKIAHSLKIKTIAEFVEDSETAEILCQMSIDFMQGNYFRPAVNYKTWLEDKLT